MFKNSGISKYLWVAIPVMLGLFFVWRNWKGEDLYSLFCQCSGCGSDQNMDQ